jgi:hypothetical protein
LVLKEPPDRIVRIRNYTVTPATRVISVKSADVGAISARLASEKNRKVRVTLRFNFKVNFVVFANQSSLVQKPFPQLLNLLLLQFLNTLENFHVLPPPKHEAMDEIIAHILVGIKITDTKNGRAARQKRQPCRSPASAVITRRRKLDSER